VVLKVTVLNMLAEFALNAGVAVGQDTKPTVVGTTGTVGDSDLVFVRTVVDFFITTVQ